MTWYVPCPAGGSSEPELVAPAQAGLAPALGQHLGAKHPGFSWGANWYVHTNCHSAPWRVPCPADRREPPLADATDAGLMVKLEQHLRVMHPTFTWPAWWIDSNCHSIPVAVPAGGDTPID